MTSGSIGGAIRLVACESELGIPLVSKRQLEKMNFKLVSSTVAGDGEIFYAPLDDDADTPNKKNFMFVMRFHDNKPIPLGTASMADPPMYRVDVEKAELLCAERKLAVEHSEYYDESNKLVHFTVPADPSVKNWIELKSEIQSPLHTLYRILCNAGEATK